MGRPKGIYSCFCTHMEVSKSFRVHLRWSRELGVAFRIGVQGCNYLGKLRIGRSTHPSRRTRPLKKIGREISGSVYAPCTAGVSQRLYKVHTQIGNFASKFFKWARPRKRLTQTQSGQFSHKIDMLQSYNSIIAMMNLARMHAWKLFEVSMCGSNRK